MAAQRLDLRQRGLQAAGLSKARHTPNMGLLDKLYDPGMFYTGFNPNSTQNAPMRAGAMNSVKMGGVAGLGSFDSMFGPAGQVKDPFGLLKLLNSGNLLGTRPTVGNANQYGTGGNTAPGDFLTRASNSNAMAQQNPLGGNGPLRQDLMSWVQSLGLQRGGGGSVGYDPSNIRYDSYTLAPGVNIQNSSRQQLEDWAQQTYGVDLMTLAASPTALLEARQAYKADPNTVFNPATGGLRQTRIPGLDGETSAARQLAYSGTPDSPGAWQRGQNEANNSRESRLGGQLLELLRSNPEAMRTGFGRQLGQTANYGQAASSAASGMAPQPWDYSLQYQSALMPEMINRAIQAALGGF